MKNSKKLIIALSSIILITGGILVSINMSSQANGADTATDSTKIAATIYKSPSCGCCGKHAAYLGTKNFSVTIIKESNMDAIKDRYNIPAAMESCHTTVIGDYIVEGHVPIEAITKLLTEKPDIDGIALPDMPAGSPGMPGRKSEPFVIYALSDGTISEYMTL